MKYLELQLKGYKRMMLNRYTHFTIRPEETIQLIVGTNGSGKSSMLAEMTPLPALSQNFTKEGFKKVTIEHRNHLYELFSGYIHNGKSLVWSHSFKKDGEELNEGRNLTTQKELSDKEFGISESVRDLIQDKIRFTDMGPSVRRQWFTDLSETSYDYAIRLFNKTKERHRDVVGAYKQAQRRLVAERAKIMPDEERIALEKEVDELYAFLNFMNEHRKPLDKDPEMLNRQHNELMERIQGVCQTLLRKQRRTDKAGFASIEEIEHAIFQAAKNYEVHSSLHQNFCEEFSKIAETVESVRRSGTEDDAEIIANIRECNETITQERSRRTILTGEHYDIETIRNALDTVWPAAQAICLELPSNKDRRYSQQLREDNQSKLNKINSDLQTIEKDLAEIKVRKAHQESHKNSDKTVCPKCSFAWVNGFTEALYKDLCDKETKVSELIGPLLEQKKVCEQYREEVENYVKLYRDLMSYVRSWPILEPLWSEINDKGYFLDNPSNVSLAHNRFKMEVESELVCLQAMKRKKEFEDKLELRKQLGNQDLDKLNKTQAALEAKIREHSTQMQSAAAAKAGLSALLSDLKQMISKTSEVEVDIKRAESLLDETVEYRRRKAYQDAIREVQSLLARKEDALSAVRIQYGVIQDLEQQIDQLEIDCAALAQLVNELSPTDGLIAEGLMGFIRVFVAQMNAFIKKIWSYPLVIVPCQPEADGSVELDYKFPVIVKDKENTINDVALGSEGMLEIFNLAFVVTAMKYLHINDGALYLDEFAAAMDQDHRHNAIEAVKGLIETFGFKQIFIISHNIEFHGAFANAQLCVLNKENIAVPKDKKYNEHVVFA
jgi:energy-coupling factor transporter ATP-binding protein EcfA2